MIAEALQTLARFKHANKTDLAAGTLTNQDALALILLRAGILTAREIQDAMMTWRFGQPERTTEVREYERWDSRKRDFTRGKFKHTKPRMYFTYLLNGTHGLGYGFVAKTIAGGRITMHSWQRSDHSWERRQLWYRHCPGHYAITVEGIVRLQELGLARV